MRPESVNLSLPGRKKKNSPVTRRGCWEGFIMHIRRVELVMSSTAIITQHRQHEHEGFTASVPLA